MSKSRRVEEYVRERIADGDWLPGTRAPSDEQLGAEVGVSYMTVRTVMRRLADEGLLIRRKRLGTYVSKTAATGYVALTIAADLLSSPVGYFYRHLLQEARAQILDAGYQPLIAAGHGETGEELVSSMHLFDTHIARQTKGLLFFGGACEEALQERCADAGIAPIFITSAVLAYDVAGVVFDYRTMLEQGLALLKALGYENYIVMYVQAPAKLMGRPFYRQFDKTVYGTAGLDPKRVVELPWGGWDYEGVYDAFKEFWAGPNRPNAIFFLDDAVCDVASRAMLELGIDVPNELAILTQANTGRHFHFPVKLTRLEFNPAEAIETAWDILDRLISKQRVLQPVIHLPPKLKQGQSLGESREEESAA